MFRFEMRPARPDEATLGGHLIFQTGPSVFSFAFARPPEAARQLLIDLWPHPGHLFSYEWTDMAVSDGAVVGLQLSYPGHQATRMGLATIRLMWRRFTLRQLIRAAWNGWEIARLSGWIRSTDYYLAYGSVLPAARGHRLGTEMALFGEKLAREAGCDRLVMDVFIENVAGRICSERAGFHIEHVATSRRLLRGTGYSGVQRLVKPLEVA